jgi:hypothetical protein
MRLLLARSHPAVFLLASYRKTGVANLRGTATKKSTMTDGVYGSNGESSDACDNTGPEPHT